MKRDKSAKSSRMPYLFVALAYFFSFYALYNKALFNAGTTQFDEPIYISALLVSILFLIMVIAFFRQLGQWNFLAVLLAALFPVSYMISYFFAVSNYLAVNEILISLFCFMLFIMGYFLAKQDSHIELAGNVILISGYVAVLFGLLNWFGNASFWGLIQYTWTTGEKKPVFQDAVWYAADGPRIASFFQYSNSYAGYLIGLVMMAAIVMLYSKKKWVVYLSAFMVVPMLVSFFLTLSRGAMVVLPFAILFLLFFLKPSKQVLLALYLLAGLVLSLPILSPVNQIGRELQEAADPGKYFLGCLIIVAASGVYTLVYWALNRYAAAPVERLGDKIGAWKWSTVYIPLLFVIVGAVSLVLLVSTGLSKMLPDSVRARIENISIGAQTVQERGTFYADALKIFADYPLFGAGGGGWKALYQTYQTYPYVSTNVHNFFLQHLVESGIIGFLFLVLLMGVMAYGYVRFLRKRHLTGQTFPHESFALVAFASGILSHSLIDFDMKYVYIAAAVFFVFGVLSRHIDIQWPKIHFPKAVPWILLIAAIFTLYLAGRLFMAHSNYQKALATAEISNEFYKIAEPLDDAVSLSKNPDYLRQKLALYQQAYQSFGLEEFEKKARQAVDDLLKYEPYNRLGYLAILDYYRQKQMHDEAKALVNRALQLFPWDPTIYDRAITLHVEWGNQEPDRASWDRAISIYDQFLVKIREQNQIPEGQLRGMPLQVPKNMALNIGQVFYLKGQYNRSAEVLQPFVNEQMNEEDRPVIRFYLASLMKLGQPNEELYTKFVIKYPEEKLQTDLLVNPISN